MTILKYYDGTDAAWKPFVNNASDAVTLSGDQTIAGKKTFTEDVNVDGDIYSNGKKVLNEDSIIPSQNIDLATFTGADFPVINSNTSNTNVNSNADYLQYTYTVPASGLYFVSFSQRMTDGTSNNDFTVMIFHKVVKISQNTSGGSTYVNYIAPTAIAVIRCDAGDVIQLKSRGGGSGSYATTNGAVSIARVL